ncbi:hypothetical protein P152DRAFT_271410 [Eremomyces bilateralis CBS 781.70]|uniref:Nudix hydrolase domain-containing protein n=1 Tax=Eremomyces bilateralis CBS 781.70 TaxID=1392243 RepID=A0A6G1G928_9PEZI|nr:uncharacterized protein P152DRAFT_271410 [Eremomyces bilateralis CBS 781.70]KAF1814436.1 hypothetical protein P152DRAFT_271410 [Eremomyces bilateralis CBS 781.70]
MTIPIPRLLSLLLDLHSQPHEHVDNPPTTQKRASVAIILRIRPTYSHPPPSSSSIPSPGSPDAESNPSAATARDRLSNFFAQDWVRHGCPEVLFIKRTSRKGDPWGGHIALPGGRRDPEDADDLAAAIRETEEEVGLTLVPWREGEQGGRGGANCITVGGLSQRVITSDWGKRALMVLCPYIFLLTTPETPSLRLQPTEVHSTHWVSLENLADPQNRTVWRQDASAQYLGRSTYLRIAAHSLLGDMLFAAIRLVPSESVWCPDSHALYPPTLTSSSLLSKIHLPGLDRDPPPSPTNTPLLLWGLTLGIVADMLDLQPLPSEPTSQQESQPLRFFVWPTFSAPDIRLAIFLISYRFRAARKETVEGRVGSGVDDSTNSRRRGVEGVVDADTTAVKGGLGDRSDIWLGELPNRYKAGNRSMMFMDMMAGYHHFLRSGVYIALTGRVALAIVLSVFFYKRTKRLSG